MSATKNGKCVIFSAPSGAGKTTIVHALLKELPYLSFSVSACNRSPRENEQHGEDYYFLSLEDFKNKIEKEEFLEWEEVYKDNFYGTLKSEVERIWAANKVVIFDVDVIGGLNLKEKLGEQALAIFVAPPTVDTLEKRLRYRSTETEEKIQTRLGKAKYELSFADKFDYILVNDLLEEAIQTAKDKVTQFVNA